MIVGGLWRGSRVEGVQHSGHRYMTLQVFPSRWVPESGMELL